MALSKLKGSVVVTGGAGFIGSNLVARLAAAGLNVTVLDNLSTGRLGNLDQIKAKYRFIEGDITEPDTCEFALTGASYVWHLAALGSVPRSIQDPQATNRANIDGTLNVLCAARKCGVKRVVFSSSSSVYGRHAKLPQEPDASLRPASPYAVSKLAGEEYMRVFYECFDLETVSLRYFNVFGPHQDPNSDYAAVIPSFVRRLLAGEPGLIQGDGEQSRDFTYIEDCLQATGNAMLAPQAAGKVYNVACGRRATINELYHTIERIMGLELPPVHSAERAGDVRHSLADISATTADLAYEPEYTLEQGLRATLPWYAGLSSKV